MKLHWFIWHSGWTYRLPGVVSRGALSLLIASSMTTQVYADANSTTSTTGTTSTTSTTESELRRLLEERDRIITSLQKKVMLLDGVRTAPAATDSGVNTTASGNAHSPSSDTSTLDTDPLAAERALERALTQSGALLLPTGQAELQIGATYARTQQSIRVVPNDQAANRTIDLRRNDYGAMLSTRIGIPYDAQLEFTIPYRNVTQSQITAIDRNAPQETHDTASVLGDISAGIAKTLLHEQDWRPDVIGRLIANVGNGREARHGIALGDGVKKIRSELTLLKRQDPLVFISTVSYESTFKKNDVKPGDQIGVSLSTLLATSPDTSMSIGIDQSFSKKMRVNGIKIAGSDQVSGVLMVGATSMVGKHTLLSINVGKGLTKDMPDYFINVTVPIRFELFK